MKISVIIPVFNAAEYVQQAVESALAQPETGEVILVEDYSSDNSLAVCQKLAAYCPNVQLFLHPDKKNHGAAASRNLAIANSTCKYIAFLDADDFFLPGRFTMAKELFNADSTVDGVYEALGEYVENAAARERWIAAHRSIGRLTTMTVRVPPDQLYKLLIPGRYGYFNLDSTTVKRSVFDITGPLNERLNLHADTDICWKMAAKTRLVPGRLDEPVAIRRIHEHNSISAPRSQVDVYRLWNQLMKEAWYWGKRNLTYKQRLVLLKRYLTGQKYLLWILLPDKIHTFYRKGH